MFQQVCMGKVLQIMRRLENFQAIGMIKSGTAVYYFSYGKFGRVLFSLPDLSRKIERDSSRKVKYGVTRTIYKKPTISSQRLTLIT